jgi:hypothetical protein
MISHYFMLLLWLNYDWTGITNWTEGIQMQVTKHNRLFQYSTVKRTVYSMYVCNNQVMTDRGRGPRWFHLQTAPHSGPRRSCRGPLSPTGTPPLLVLPRVGISGWSWEKYDIQILRLVFQLIKLHLKKFLFNPSVKYKIKFWDF